MTAKHIKDGEHAIRTRPGGAGLVKSKIVIPMEYARCATATRIVAGGS
jgi:hypothetical protein